MKKRLVFICTLVSIILIIIAISSTLFINRTPSISSGYSSVETKEPKNDILEFVSKKDSSKETGVLQVILYKPSCKDCQKAEKDIVTSVKKYSGQFEEDTTVVINVEKGIPEYLENIKGIYDEGKKTNVPLILDVTRENGLWKIIDRYTGTNGKRIEKAINYRDYSLYKQEEVRK